jgi:regulator of replication initiation timing
MAKTGRTLDLEPIDRLEEKVKLLVGLVERLRNEQARLAEDNARLAGEIEAARGRLSDSDRATAEAAALRAERDEIRTRVTEMLDQLESLNL